MLDPAELADPKQGAAKQAQDFQRALVAVNGLQAAQVLYPKLTAGDQNSLRDAVARQDNKEQPPEIRLKGGRGGVADERSSGGSNNGVNGARRHDWPYGRSIRRDGTTTKDAKQIVLMKEIESMATTEEVIELLRTAYSMELETVMNYLAYSTNLDGVRAEEIKKSLAVDINEELGHATQLAQRIKQLGGLVPGSLGVKLGNQTQPTANTTDVVGVIKSVIAAEEAACAPLQEADSRDRRPRTTVTQDVCVQLLKAEEEHLMLFKGFLKEYTQN